MTQLFRSQLWYYYVFQYHFITLSRIVYSIRQIVVLRLIQITFTRIS
jgi:hypothetical protein